MALRLHDLPVAQINYFEKFIVRTKDGFLWRLTWENVESLNVDDFIQIVAMLGFGQQSQS
jgi:hypothetical protein